MCLSRVYLNEKRDDALYAEEAAVIVSRADCVEVQTLFGARKLISGYVVGEVNLIEHYVILTPERAVAHGT